jgi:hypothetical protein
MRHSLFLPLVLLVAGVFCPSKAQADDMVLRWNASLREAMKRDSIQSNPGYATRAMAMMNGAIYDCYQAVQRTHRPIHADLRNAAADPDAAAAAAAYAITKELYPPETFFLTWSYRYSVDPINESPAKTAGIALGEAVAAAYLNWRQEDGFDSSVPYEVGDAPGEWQPDPYFIPRQEAWGPGWGKLQTFVVKNTQQFPVPPAPALESPEYAAAYNEVKDYGADDSEVRTIEQFHIGNFWAYDRPGMGPPPVMYNRSILAISQARNLDVRSNARLFALASLAMADASICAWDAKFADNLWRPVTGIQQGDLDENPDTEKREDWRPLGCPGGGVYPNFTPAFPSYVSGHASMGEAAFRTLERFFQTDAMSFSLTSEEVPGMVRNYTSFSQAAQENADSRVWLGVHWRFDQTEGQALGKKVADYVIETAARPVTESYTDFAAFYQLTTDGTGDYDGDGLSDFAEYAFGSHPWKGDGAPAARVQVINNETWLVLPYRLDVSRLAAGLRLVPEVSTNLTTWTTQGITDMADPEQTSGNGIFYRMAGVRVLPGPSSYLRMRGSL